MTTFVFPLKGVHCSGCKGNLQYVLDEETKPEFFKFKKIDVSPNFQKLVIEIEDPSTSEEEVRRYITHTLASSDYALVEESARHYWIWGSVGLLLGSLILILSITNNLVLFPIKLLTALISMGLTLYLGAESFRKANIELQRRKPAMDSLFMLSTGAATTLSLMALMVPTMPLMFEASLFIFGFRYIGIALKKSIYATPNLPVHYRRLNANNRQPSTIPGQPSNELRPGDTLAIQAGDMIPIDGWLLAKSTDLINQTYPMNVTRIRGAYLPEHLQAGDAVAEGMEAQVDCVMQVGLGHHIRYFCETPLGRCPEGEIWIYPVDRRIQVAVRSDLYNRVSVFELSEHELTDKSGHNHFHTILTSLQLNTVSTHLSKPAQQQLSRALVPHAAQYDLTKTASSLARLEKELEDAACKAAPIQEKADQILGYFVPVVLGVAVVSGAIAACFFSPQIAVRCMISILVSACPCTLGFVTPLVMDFARTKGKQAGVVFSQPDSIQRLSEAEIVLLDIHGTATEGKSAVQQIVIHDTSRTREIETQLARLEQHVDQHIGKAIYAAVNGDELLRDTWRLEEKDIERLPGGIGARIEGKHYVLGNSNLLRHLGIPLANSQPNTTYLLEQEGASYRLLATIDVHDPLRSDAALTVQQMKKRGLKVYLLTGADQKTAEKYAQDLPGLDGIYAGFADGPAKREKVRSIQEDGPHPLRVLMIGDGANDGPAMKAAHASIAMKHSLSDEGAQYQAQARILNHSLLTAVDAVDIATQAMWRIKLNLWLSLIYNLAVVIVTNFLVLAMGIVLHPGICAALMVMQVGFIIASTYYFKQQPLPTKSLPSQTSLFRERAPLTPSENGLQASGLSFT